MHHRPNVLRLLTIALLFLMAGCGGPSKGVFTILSGSENATLEPIVVEYCRREGWDCRFTYLGSVDIKLALEQAELDFDAVWPAHSRWIEMGDRARRVQHSRSIMSSPVAFGIRRDIAQRLGLIGRPVTTAELVGLVDRGQLRFLKTSATQSNSGFSAYLAMLQALAGNPEVLTPALLEREDLHAALRTLLSGVERSAGSSGWLKDLYLEGAGEGRYQAMVNYEAVLIEANQALTARGLEPLYLIYPADGTAVADSPLGFIKRSGGDQSAREAFFLALQGHLLSESVQRSLLAQGRRTGLGGVLDGTDPGVFAAAWGIDPQRPLAHIRMPSAATIERALTLYQEVLRRPSLLAICLDYSGSMTGAGEEALETAISRLFDPEIARSRFLQPSRHDVLIVLPFDATVRGVLTARGPDAVAALPGEILTETPGGGTDLYACLNRAIDELRRQPEWTTHLAAVIAMTDGRSQGDANAFETFYRNGELDVPVFGITFGDAVAEQLEALARLTRGKVFDGRKNLETAFRHARGYS